MQVEIKAVNIENVVKGKSRYQIAHVDYGYRGETKTRKIMSFANPEVFKNVQGMIGQTVEVEVGKNDAGYDEWKRVSVDAGAAKAASPSAAPATTRVTGSNYETKEERAARQVLIVKQSSLSAAVATLAPGAKAALDPKAVIDLAQQYTDWVFEQPELTVENMTDDIPY